MAHMAKFLLPALLGLTIVCSASDNSQPLALIQHAVDISNLRTPDVAPFRLRARVHVYGEDPVNADYLLIWATAERWREEISVGNNRAIRVGGKATISIKDDSDQAQSIRSQLRLLDLAAVLYVKPNDSLGDVKSRNHDVARMQCLSRTAKQGSKTELCFDAATGVLVKNESGNSTTEFSKYSEFKGKLFPRLVTIFHGKTPYELIEVQDLAYDSDHDASLFDSDARYKTMAGCEHPVAPTPIRLPDPEYPAQLRTRNPQVVRLSATVNETGGVENIVVTRSAGALDVYAIKALGTWKFAPATCGSRAVPVQFFFEVNFKTH
jgi:TonB family protein